MFLDLLAACFGKGWLWDRCGVCGHSIWLRKKRLHSVKFKVSDYAWITLPLCLLCSIDFSRMEKDAEWRKRTN